jgi:cell division topological specificity factor
MSVLRFFQRPSSAFVSEPSGSASAARDRLTVLLAHERAVAGHSKLVEALRDEILAVIGKHAAIERDKVQVKMERGEGVSTLAIDIEIPALFPPKVAA